MIVNETAAKTRWCPLSRLGEMGATYNRTGPAANLECIGTACMAWRETAAVWQDPRGNRFTVGGDARVKIQSSGYCGAFGRPEGLDAVEGIK